VRDSLPLSRRHLGPQCHQEPHYHAPPPSAKPALLLTTTLAPVMTKEMSPRHPRLLSQSINPAPPAPNARAKSQATLLPRSTPTSPISPTPSRQTSSSSSSV